MAHFLLEVHARLLQVGRAEATSFDLAFSQEVMADVLGEYDPTTESTSEDPGSLDGDHTEASHDGTTIVDGSRRIAILKNSSAPVPSTRTSQVRVSSANPR